jgi:hypothetical protein
VWSRPVFMGVPVAGGAVAVFGPGSWAFFVGNAITGVYFAAVAFNINGAAEALCEKLHRPMPVGRRTYTGDVHGVKGIAMGIVLACVAGMCISGLQLLADAN